MKFNYQARTKEGEIQAGQVEAPSKEAALSLLERYGLYVTLLEEEKSVPIYARKIKIFERITKKDIVIFTRQLSTMFISKVPLMEALQTLAQHTKKSDFKEKILKISEDIEGGMSLSKALARHPSLFSSFYVSMVKSGEISGKLSEVLDYLADYLEREYNLVSKMRSAAVYPAFVLFVFFIILGVLIIFVIPKVSLIFEATGRELPFLTQIVFNIAEFLRKNGWILLLIILAIFSFIYYYLKTKEGRKFVDRIYLKVPLFSDFLKKYYLARLANNLSTLISAGIPIAKSLETTAGVVGNDVYKTAILEARNGVRRGETITSILARYPEIFSPFFIQMTSVGEKTGRLDEVLMNVTNFYQKEIERTINSFLAILEPVMIVFLGLLVGGLVISILLPLYQIGVM